MRAVWDALSKDQDTYLPHAFFDFAIACRRQWAQLSKTPTAELEAQLGTIATKAEALAKLVADSEREIALLLDWPLTAERLLRERIQKGTRPTNPQPIAFEETPAQSIASDGEDLPETEAGAFEDEQDGTLMESFLLEFAAALRRPLTSVTARIRQRKPNDRNAERTFLARATAHFFLNHGGRIRYEFVARIVTAMLDLDPPMEADLARRVLTEGDSDLTAWLWGRADDYAVSSDGQ